MMHNGVLRKINDKALKMYGVCDRTTVIDKVNLFNSPYMDEELKSKIQRGEDVTLEFEYELRPYQSAMPISAAKIKTL